MHRLILRPSALLLAALLACSGAGDTTSDADTTAATSNATGDADTTADAPTTGGGPDCGNGTIDDGEDCDGTDLGGKACGDLDPATPLGTLACSGACTYDTDLCMAAGGSFVALNEVASQGADAGPFAGLGDAIELYNPGAGAVDMSGWKLSDDPAFPDDKTYVFPAGASLAPGAFQVLVTYDDVAMTGDFPFGLSSSAMETLTLADAGGATVDQLIFLGADATISYCRLPDGEGAWQQCDSSLGGANVAATMICGDGTLQGDEACEGGDLGGAACTDLGFTGGALACVEGGCTFDTSMCTSDSAVALNELESTDDHVEIFNSGGAAVDISGWILTDEYKGPDYDPTMDDQKLEFPAGSTLGAGVYLDVAKGTLPGQHPFGLGADGDTVTLLTPELTLVDQVTYGNQQAAVSYCRIPDGPGTPWLADCIPTFGLTNMHP
ncbi:MAG: lamin tail domain-containing protein [Myxococcales bacterium]|nr:lamin tail domain-containing protein [Myxococcales bacterium]